MLERIEIENYRSCVEVTLDLQPDLSVFIGPNGSGKTTLLSACLLLQKLADERAIAMRDDEPASDECRIKATFRPDEGKAILTAKVKLYTNDANKDVIVDSRQSWYAKDYTSSAKRIRMPLTLSNFLYRAGDSYDLRLNSRIFRTVSTDDDIDAEVPDEFVPPFQKIARYVQGFRYYSASQFTNPSNCPVSFEANRDGKYLRTPRSSGGHTRFLLDLYGEYKDRTNSNFDEFYSVVGPGGIGLIDSIDFKEIETSSVDVLVRSGGRVRKETRARMLVVPQFTIGQNQLSPSQLSEGTFKTITLLFYVMTQQSSALLIEEPEVCVHHGLLSSIVELIKAYSKEKQILMSTHSDFVLDQCDPNQVYSVTRNAEEGTTVSNIRRSLSASELSALKQFLQSEGNLGEYWRDGGLE